MSFSCINAQWQHLSFDDAMQKNNFPNVYTLTTQIMNVDGIVLYNFFKNLYEKFHISIKFCY